MKWRRTVLLLTILATLAGYYYYEGIGRDREQRRQAAAKRVFHFDPERILRLKISGRAGSTVELENRSHWLITAPVKTEADEESVEALLGALSTLQMKKLIAEKTRQPTSFGLDRSSLTIDLYDVEKNHYRLIVGAKNPVGDGRYAKVSGSERILLISAGDYGILDKNLHELRRRDLFAFRDSDVRELDVQWADGKSLRVVRQTGVGAKWRVPQRPDLVIKSSKVENVLDQLRWLRALSFLEEGVRNLERYGLDHPRVIVRLTLEADRSFVLRIGNEVKKRAAVCAVCSTLANVITVQSDFLKDLPRALENLEDRSLFALRPERIQRIVWRLGTRRGECRRTGEERWSYRTKSGRFRHLMEPWRVQALFWELQDIEYDGRSVSTVERPVCSWGMLSFYDDGGEIGSLSWPRPSTGRKDQRLTVRITGSRSLNVDLKVSVVERIEKKLEEITPQADPGDSQ